MTTAAAVPTKSTLEEAVPAENGPTRRPVFFSLGRFLATAAFLLVVLVAGTSLWIGWGLPELDLDRPAVGQPSITLEAADGTPIAQSGGRYLGPVERDDLPEHLVQAVLAIEDRKFYEHMGVDPVGVLRAAWRNYQAGDIVQGGSTITQQLAKVLFLTPEQTLRRKLQEAWIAAWLDTRLSKDQILTKYLDSIYFGAGATGISAAADVYFGKSVADLSLAESAVLAGVIRAPSRLNPITNPQGAQERATLVLDAMVKSGFIRREQAIEAALNPAAPARGSQVALTGSWFGDWISGEATSAMGPLVGNARIRTTLQPALQAAAEQTVRDALEGPGRQQNVGQAALVAMDLNGAVLAMVGGRSYQESQFNRAVDALRQPGSAFKTFVYLAALRAGRTPESQIVDQPVDFNGWSPKNFSGRYYGKVTLQEAFARSLNAATVTLAQEVGIENVVATAHDLGIDAKLEPNLALALGTAEVSLLDLTGAYASIGAGRTPVQPWGIAGLTTDPQAEPTMFTKDASGTPLGNRDEMVQLLESVVTEGTGTRAALEGFAAGKTGTSQNYRDAWFIGFTDKLVVGVWVGNDDNSPMKDVTGGRLPAEIWRDFVAKATGTAPAESGPEDVPVATEPPADEGVEIAAVPVARPQAVPERPVSEPKVAAKPEVVDEPRIAPEPKKAAPARKAASASEPAPAARQKAPAAAKPKPRAPEVAANRTPEPKKVTRAEPKPKAEPRPQRAAKKAAPVVVVREPPQGPVVLQRALPSRLAENRALAEEYVARRRAVVEGRLTPPARVARPGVLWRARPAP